MSGHSPAESIATGIALGFVPPAGVKFPHRLPLRVEAVSCNACKLSAVRWDKTKNSVFWAAWAATHNLIVIARRHIPDDCLTNGICGLDYHFWRYRIPLAFDGYPILTLPHIVAGAVTVSVGATQHSLGGPHMLKPITHFTRNLRELPPVHCNGSSRANCAERERRDQWLSLAFSQRRNCNRHSPLHPRTIAKNFLLIM